MTLHFYSCSIAAVKVASAGVGLKVKRCIVHSIPPVCELFSLLKISFCRSEPRFGGVGTPPGPGHPLLAQAAARGGPWRRRGRRHCRNLGRDPHSQVQIIQVWIIQCIYSVEPTACYTTDVHVSHTQQVVSDSERPNAGACYSETPCILAFRFAYQGTEKSLLC